jgi:uncharacterized membrane protein YcaP (DUF421 family)
VDVVLRAVVIYVVVFAFTRALDRRELSTLQPFDLILLIVIGDLIQSGVTQNDLSVTGVLLVLCTIGIMQVLTSYAGLASADSPVPGARPMNAGLPSVVMPQAASTGSAGEPGCMRKKEASRNR